MRKVLSKSDIKELNTTLTEWYGMEPFFHKKDRVENEDEMYLIRNKEMLFFFRGGKWVPSLKLLLKELLLPKVVVDKGAVRFVVNGADIMRPGIVTCDEFADHSLVVITEETHGKPLAVGIAKLSSVDLLAEEKGKVVQVIHYVGDKIWNYLA